MTGSLNLAGGAGRSQRRRPPPAWLPSGYLLAALALLVLTHPAILGWIVGAGVVRGGWVSRGRLAAAANVTGAPALLFIDTTLTQRWPLAGPPEASRSIGPGHHRLAALARSRPETTT
jgi:hypothetical protein